MVISRPRPQDAKTLPPRKKRRGRHGMVAVGSAVGAVVLALGLWAARYEPPAPSAPKDLTALLLGRDADMFASTFQLVTGATTERRVQLAVGPLLGGEVRYTVIDTAPVGGEELARAADAKEKAQLVEDTYARLTHQAPEQNDTVVDGLHQLDQQIASRPHGAVEVVMLGSSLRIGAGVDLGSPVQRSDPIAAAERVIASGLLPNCKGYRFYLVGAASVEGQPLDALGDTQVLVFYSRLVKACGGTLVVWNSTQLTTYPVKGPVLEPSLPACQVTVRLPAGVLFETGRAELQPSAVPALRELVSALRQSRYRGARVQVRGFTDDRGDTRANLRLGTARAQVVKRWLAAHGADGRSVAVQGMGEQEPVADNGTAAGRAQNRRVDVVIHLHSCPGS